MNIIKKIRGNTYSELWKKLKTKIVNIKNNGMFADHYVEWRGKRIQAIIDHYGRDFFVGKTVLELGCGYGDIGAAFYKMGAIVTCSDARKEHLNVVKKRYPKIKILLLDLDNEQAINQDFDVIIDLGVLYHLQNYKLHLKNVIQHANHLILETEVVDSKDPDFVVHTEESGYDQAFNGRGCRPSATGIEKFFKENKVLSRRYESPKLNSGFHRYDWKETNAGTWVHGQRRFWFAEVI